MIRTDDDTGLSGSGSEFPSEGGCTRDECQAAGLGDQGDYLQYMPSDRDGAGPIARLMDGDSTIVALSEASIDMAGNPGAYAAPATTVAPVGGVSSGAMSPLMWGGLGLGVAAVALGASSGGNGNSASTGASGSVKTDRVPAIPIQAPAGYRDNAGTVQSERSTASITDDGTPGLHVGMLPEDATGAVLYVDGVVAPSSYAAMDGTLTPTAPLMDGSHTLGYGWSNATGVTPSSPALTVDVDATPPEMPSKLQIVDADFDGKPNISGMGEPNGIVTITDPTGVAHTAKVDSSGHFELEIDMPSKATGEWTATVMDAAGNVSPPASITLTAAQVATPVIANVIDKVGNILGPIVDHGYTDDLQPMLMGTATPGVLVEVRDGDKILGFAVTGQAGDWTFTPSSSIGEGNHALTVRAVDPVGNVSKDSESLAFTVDVTPPRAADIGGLQDKVGPIEGQIVDGTVTDDATPTFEGWAEPGTTVWIGDKGAVLGSTTVQDTGYWSFTPDSDLADGAHALSTRVVDKAGNASGETAQINFQIDTLAPTVPTLIDSVKDGQGAVTGKVRSDTTIDDAQPEFTGTAEAGTTVTLMDGNREIGSATTGLAGQWIITPDRPLSLGEHHFTATAVDAAGNVGKPSDPFSFSVRTGGAPTGTAINALVDDVGVAVTIARGGLANDPTPIVQGKAQAGTVVTLYTEDKFVLGKALVDPLGEWRIMPSPALTDGPHTLTAVATNTVDGSSRSSGGFQVMVDTKTPDQAKDLVLADNVGTVQDAIAGGASTDDATPTLSGTAESGATVTINDNGAYLGTTTAGKDGTWSFTSPANLADGRHSFTTVVTDAAGNASPTPTPAIAFTVDTRKIVVSIDGAVDDASASTRLLASSSITNDRRPTFSGNALAGGTVTLYDGNSVVGTTVADGVTGRWSIEPTTNLSEKSHDLSATVTTAAGVSERTALFNLVIDATAPDAPQIRKVDDNAGSKKGPVADGAPPVSTVKSYAAEDWPALPTAFDEIAVR